MPERVLGQFPCTRQRLFDSQHDPGAPGPAEAAGAPVGYHLLPAVRADFLRRDGRRGEAAQAYRDALTLPCNEAERRFLTRRRREVSDAGAGPPRAHP
jgi:hypothetical protein